MGTKDTQFLWTPRIYFTVTLSIIQSQDNTLDIMGV